MGMVCFYHDDLDGECSAAIVRHLNKDVKCYPCNHGIPLQFDKIKGDDTLVIVDFTPNSKEDFDKVIELAKNVIWIDHHQSSIDKFPELNEKLEGARADTKPSGAMLTWQYFSEDENVYDFIKYVSDFDTWSWDLKESKDFLDGTRAEDTSPESKFWKELFAKADLETKRVCRNGPIIRNAYENANRDILDKHGYEVEFEGHDAMVCNVDNNFGSLFFSSVMGEYDIYIPFMFDGEKYNFSIYTESDSIKVNEIAMKYGGGGHPQAAGFKNDELPFEKK